MTSPAQLAPPPLQGMRRRRPAGEPPPLPRDVSRGALVLFGLLAFFTVAWVALLSAEETRVGVWFNEQEGALMRTLIEPRVEWLEDAFEVVHAIGYTWAVPIIGWTVMVLLLAAKRLRHFFTYFGALLVVSLFVLVISLAVQRSRPWGFEQLVAWEGFAQPSLPVAQLAAVLVGASASLLPRGPRRYFTLAGAGFVILFGLSRIYLGVEYPSDAVVGAIVGSAITLGAFVLVCPETVFPVGFQRGRTAHLDIGGPRGEAIQRAVSDQLGIEVLGIASVGLADSAGSTPMSLSVTGCDQPCLFGKLYAASHLRSDRWYKLGRTLLYGRLEDESRFENVRRLVEREDYLLRVMQDAGIRSSAPYGIAVITPEREYLIVTEFLDGAVELTDADIDDAVIDDALQLVRKLWDHGLAHRDIKPSNVMLRDGEVYVIDVAFGQIRPSPWREAVDLANMMLTLALRSTPEKVYAAALVYFSPHEVAEAFAAARGLALPSQLRHQLDQDERDLLNDFRRLAPARPLMPMQRWSVRRIGLAVWVATLLILGLVLGVGNLDGMGLL